MALRPFSISLSFTTSIAHGWRFMAEGAAIPALSTDSKTSFGTGSSRNLRTLLRDIMFSLTISATVTISILLSFAFVSLSAFELHDVNIAATDAAVT